MKKLGFGFMRLPLIDDTDRRTIDYDSLYKMVDAYMSAGFSYFDTAYHYHNGYSEVALRKAVVERYERDKLIIADKMPMLMVKKKEQLDEIFEEQLVKCGVSYFDYYLLHAVGYSNYSTINKIAAFDYLRKKKKEGKIKKIGFSYHADAELLDKILFENPDVDVVQLQLNYLDWEDPLIESRKCYEIAEKHKKEVIVMEPIKGGVLANLPDDINRLFKDYSSSDSSASWALRYAASKKNVVLVLSGMSDITQVDDNISNMNCFEPMNNKEYLVIEEVVKKIKKIATIPCTSCYYCVRTCPKQIKIPEYFAIYNNWKQNKKTQMLVTSMYYSNLINNSCNAKECIKCGKCKKECPQHIDIATKLQEANKELMRVSMLALRGAYRKNMKK